MNRGRPTSYKPEYCEQIIDFFSIKPYGYNEITKKYEANDPPFLSAFARKIKINDENMWEWSKKYPDFGNAYKKAKKLQEEFIATNAVRGLYEQPMSIFMLKNVCGWRDKTEVEHSGFIESTEEKAAIKNEVKDFMQSMGVK